MKQANFAIIPNEVVNSRQVYSLSQGDSMTARMKINQPLTPDLAKKWKRLLASQGGDPEALALVAVELLWKKYGKEVEKFERDDLAYRKKLAAEYVRVVRPAKREGGIAGRSNRKFDAKRRTSSGEMTEDELVRYLAKGN